MTLALTEHGTEVMARKPPAKTPGPTILKNLHRLGYAVLVPRSSELAALIQKATGRTVTRQRISAIVAAAAVEPETVELLAKAIGVKPSELARDE